MENIITSTQLVHSNITPKSTPRLQGINQVTMVEEYRYHFPVFKYEWEFKPNKLEKRYWKSAMQLKRK